MENERKQEFIDVIVTIIFYYSCVLVKLSRMYFWTPDLSSMSLHLGFSVLESQSDVE